MNTSISWNNKCIFNIYIKQLKVTIFKTSNLITESLKRETGLSDAGRQWIKKFHSANCKNKTPKHPGFLVNIQCSIVGVQVKHHILLLLLCTPHNLSVPSITQKHPSPPYINILFLWALQEFIQWWMCNLQSKNKPDLAFFLGWCALWCGIHQTMETNVVIILGISLLLPLQDFCCAPCWDPVMVTAEWWQEYHHVFLLVAHGVQPSISLTACRPFSTLRMTSRGFNNHLWHLKFPHWCQFPCL